MQQLKIVASDRVKDNAAFMDFVRRLPETFDTVGHEIHTARNRLRIMDVSQLGVEGLSQVMVKRYHGLFWFQKLDYTYFRKPKCRKAFDNTAELRRRGFEAAEEFAIVEVWNHGLYQYAFFVSEVARGERLDSLIVRLMEKDGNEATAKTIMKQFAAHLYCMHQKGILYKDMNAGNVMVTNDDTTDSYHFKLIDTNRAKFFDEDKLVPMADSIADLILMNPRMQLVEYFIGEYLRCRGTYTEEEVARIRDIQRKRHEKKHSVKMFLKRYKKRYYSWLEQ